MNNQKPWEGLPDGRIAYTTTDTLINGVSVRHDEDLDEPTEEDNQFFAEIRRSLEVLKAE